MASRLFFSNNNNNNNAPPPGLPPRPRYTNAFCPGYQRQRPWTAERIAQIVSNVFVLVGTAVALIFAILAVREQGMEDYIVLTVFIVGGTLFGGGCLLALINVSWLSRRPGVRVSSIQLICNLVLGLITSYLLLLFWPYPSVAYSILFTAGVPMLVMINLPSCFMRPHPEFIPDGDTVCLDQDAADDATIGEDRKTTDDTQYTAGMDASEGHMIDPELGNNELAIEDHA